LAVEINGYVSGFARGQILVASILTVLYLIGFGAILSLKLWFLLAIISGFGNVIPYFGTILAIVLGCFLALLTYGDLTHVLYVLLVIGFIQLLEGFFITPKIVGSSVGMTPLMVILALFVGGQLFGLLGLFLAIPGAAIFRVLLSRLHSWVMVRVS